MEPYGWFKYRLEDLDLTHIRGLSLRGGFSMMLSQSERHLRRFYEENGIEGDPAEMYAADSDKSKLTHFFWEGVHSFFDTTTFSLSLKGYDLHALNVAYHYTNYDVSKADKRSIADILNRDRVRQ
jgi:hypothetical protein